MNEIEQRPGEQALPSEPGYAAEDAAIAFIGIVHSPWKSRTECPKNMQMARQKGLGARLVIHPALRPALLGLEDGSYLHVLTWLDRAPRDLLVQRPRHLDQPRGTFALRSPVRPNPVGLHTVRIVAVDHGNGTIEIDAIDCLDRTPIVDLKPYYATIDSFPDANSEPR